MEQTAHDELLKVVEDITKLPNATVVDKSLATLCGVLVRAIAIQAHQIQVLGAQIDDLRNPNK